MDERERDGGLWALLNARRRPERGPGKNNANHPKNKTVQSPDARVGFLLLLFEMLRALNDS